MRVRTNTCVVELPLGPCAEKHNKHNSQEKAITPYAGLDMLAGPPPGPRSTWYTRFAPQELGSQGIVQGLRRQHSLDSP